MGREVRKVPKDWEHPRDHRGHLIPLHDRSYAQEAQEFLAIANEKGLQEAVEYMNLPREEDFMPDWPPSERTHVQMYEDTSEGTPISPVFATIEELARWLADTGASALGSCTATYEQWLATCQRGWAPSAVGLVGPEGTRMTSGVAGLASFSDHKEDK
jgi:hypothetical protein